MHAKNPQSPLLTGLAPSRPPSTRLRSWALGLQARVGHNKATVALANKLVRIAWAMMSTGESFRTELYTKA